MVSANFRRIIESAAPGLAEFFEVRISCEDETVAGFYAINLRTKVSCIDLQQSEYRQTNFDPSDPAYSFSYLKVQDAAVDELETARCAEQPAYIVAGEKLKLACQNGNVGGLMFCRAIDLTYADRTVCGKS